MSVPGVWGGQWSSDPGNHSYGWLWTTMKELGIKTRPSARATYALNHWAVSPTSLPITSPAFLSRRSLSPGYSVWPQSASNTLTTQVNQSVVDWQGTALTSDFQTFNLAEICKEPYVSLRTKWNSDPVTRIGLEATTLHAEKNRKAAWLYSERSLQQSTSKRKMVAQGSEMKNRDLLTTDPGFYTVWRSSLECHAW